MEQYISKSALVAEIERRATFFLEESKKKTTLNDSSCAVALYGLLSFINILEVKEAQEEPISEDLEEAAFDYAEACKYEGGEKLLCVEHFKAGSEWVQEKMMGKYIEKQGDKKSAWSDDDEQYLLVCKNALAKYQTTDKWDASIISCWLEDKLKSLRPQNKWKPSEEQMEALANALSLAKNCGEESSFDLRTLYEDLKKLKEE